MSTQSLLYLHLFCAFFSLSLLAIRGRMQIKHKDWRASAILRIFPHLSDTLLVLSGAGLWWLTDAGFVWWIILKLGLVLEYIVFSAKYFNRKNPPQNSNAFFMALLCLSSAVLLGYYH